MLLSCSVDIYPPETRTGIDRFLIRRYHSLLKILQGYGDPAFYARCSSPRAMATAFYSKRALVEPGN